MKMTRKEAEELLAWGHEQNPGPWADHCRTAGRAAETIAKKCGLDADRAYVSGLLHDIGVYDYRDFKRRKADHIFMGYELMTDKGHEDIARICLSHSFTLQDIKTLASSYIECNDEDLALITAFLNDSVYDDYDKLIQLCDSLSMAHGVVLMEKRMMDVVRRKGFGDMTVPKWEAIFGVKDYFDKLCGADIYSLFHDEIQADIFGD